MLEALAGELGALRRPLRGDEPPRLRGPVARRMVDAAWPHRAVHVTPMVAVAGAVADEMLAALVAGRRLARAYVNDGGDIALHLAPGERFRVGMVARIEAPAVDAAAQIEAASAVRGVATSGWRGRSRSLGIADAVTVLARSAADADAAATLIANDVDVEHAAIERVAACDLDDDTDLGERLVTVGVPALPAAAIEAALDRGAATAGRHLERGLVAAAALRLQGRGRVVGTLALAAPCAPGQRHANSG